MSRKTKLFNQYDQNEVLLKELLVTELNKVIVNNNDLLFCTDYTNPFYELKYKTSKKGTEIYKLALDNLKLAKQLKIDHANSVAFFTIKYFNMWGDINNHHQGRVSKIAQLLLEKINKNN